MPDGDRNDIVIWRASAPPSLRAQLGPAALHSRHWLRSAKPLDSSGKTVPESDHRRIRNLSDDPWSDDRGSRWGLAMMTHARLLGIVVAVTWLGWSAASAAGGMSKDIWKGAWKFEIDRQDRPYLGYYDTRGKTVFRIGCGAHFEMDAVYPGEAPKQDHTKASITIANGKTQMDFAGFTYAGPESFPPNTTMFNQPDLGYPELAEDKWRALENRVFNLLDSGQPLTISAEGKSYVLPPVELPRWRPRFQKIC
ncbi:hypothetical protein ACVWW6_006762 [Bradyrhizobium sp. USDA 3311]|uniref:hypothetical protein n=2 Tax=Nitrobacteraceae TaxID=41294 RepID=UPI001FEF380B|nr:hypothetical protein [Bradyrhizobium sp. LCT2]